MKCFLKIFIKQKINRTINLSKTAIVSSFNSLHIFNSFPDPDA